MRTDLMISMADEVGWAQTTKLLGTDHRELARHDFISPLQVHR